MKQAINSAKSFFRINNVLNLSVRNKSLIFIFLCLISGMIFGSLSVNSLNMESLHKIDFLFLNDFQERISQTGIEIFISSFFILSLFALIIELSALSCWGVIFIPLVMTVRGLSLGLTAGYLYSIYALKGIAFYILILLPGIFISSLGLAIFSSESLKFSSKLLRVIVPKSEDEKLWDEFKYHLRKSGYCLILMSVSSLIDLCFTSMFSRFFNF